MESIELSFLAAEGETVLKSAEKTALRAVFDKKRLSIEIWYDFSEEPLRLSAEAESGDEVRLVVNPVRIALFVSGKLADEEWPCGNGYLSAACTQSGAFPVKIRSLGAGAAVAPAPLRTGITTDELRAPGVNIGDCMPYSDEDGDGRYHLFYLLDRHHHKSKWRLGAHQWAHASTKDFLLWDEHPLAVPITESWEGSICTGSVIKAGGLWHAWYAVRMADRSPAHLSCAVSKDLLHFEKTGEWFTLPDVYDQGAARDPRPFYSDGLYHMLITTRLKGGGGCLAHLVSERMAPTGWQDAGCFMNWHDFCPPGHPEREQTPECPDWFFFGGYYYLVFGIGSVSRYLYSKGPLGPWTRPEDERIPCGAVPKSALLPGTGRRVFMGFQGEGGYAGSLCAAEAFPNGDGTLRFQKIELS